MAYQYYGIDYLRRKLTKKRTRVIMRYDFYEMKNRAKDFGISTPPQMRFFNETLGWCAKAVDSLADRLQVREFDKDTDTFDLNGIYQSNNPDVLYDSAILESLIGSCSFIYISGGDDGYPRMQVIDASNATGIIDPITGLLKEGYAVLERDDVGNPTIEAYFTAEETICYFSVQKKESHYRHSAGRPLLVPIIYRPDAKRPFGHSRISRACMSLTDSALRTIKRGEISAEFYSFPQKYVTGLSEEAEIEKWSAAMSAMMTFTKDEDGDHPIIGQFTQQSMDPHISHLRMFAALFAGETGLTLDDLGFVTDNPSSAEAIKASHENLRLTARKAQKTFSSGFLNAGMLAACLRDGVSYDRSVFRSTLVKWEPIFEPDLNALSLVGDGAIKINQAVPGYFNDESLYDLTGIKGAEQ